MIDYHDGYSIVPVADDDKNVDPHAVIGIETTDDDLIRLQVTTTKQGRVGVHLTPEDALDLALYLQRERRLIEKGSG